MRILSFITNPFAIDRILDYFQIETPHSTGPPTTYSVSQLG